MAGPDKAERGIPRRVVLGALGALPLAGSVYAQAPIGDDTPESVFRAFAARAESLAAADYVEPSETLPDPFRNLGYDSYRRVRAQSARAAWAEGASQFAVLPLPRGWLFRRAVVINLVEDGVAKPPLDLTPFVDFEDFPDLGAAERAALGISGWRALKRGATGDWDEIAVFQGGVYFRAVAPGLNYGISARALAIGTAAPGGEEFPDFTEFTVFKPAVGATSLEAVALLDSPSVAGAYRFRISPGVETVMEIQATLIPRRPLATMGIAAASSMFSHGPADRVGTDDFRTEVHDSDGLAIQMRNGERVWRPLANPRWVQVSSFHAPDVAGFGLLQRQRDFTAYSDYEARYERRPSLWVEPLSVWGEGAVVLTEIPTLDEYNDNIVAFWRPATPWSAGQPQSFAYRLRWNATGPEPDARAPVAATRVGATPHAPGNRRFVVDFTALNSYQLSNLSADVWCSDGEVRDAHVVVEPGVIRVAFDFNPKGARSAEFHAALLSAGTQISETWLFRWTPD